jgi:sulfite reductase alpha subunit-like flavoprotein
MGPRLFTIASSWKIQKNVVVIASIVEDGLISKHFTRKPQSIMAELRKSTFLSIDKLKKVIFVGIGTGFAAFRGYLQEKELSMK